MQFTQVELAIVFTLAYSDQFNYPLTQAEIWQRLIKIDARVISQKKYQLALHQLVEQKIVGSSGNFYYLAGRKSVVKKRLQRMSISEKKIREIQLLKRIVRYIPWIRAVFITGSVAMRNADSADDIDLFMVTQKNRLWLSRLCLLSVVWVIGKKKTRFDEGKHGWCFNLWLDERHLAVPPTKADLYQAYEIVQAQPIAGLPTTIRQFYRQNQWLLEYLPQAKLNLTPEIEIKNPVRKKGLARLPNWQDLVDQIEKIAFSCQLEYMKNHRTTEQIGPGFAFFHPRPTDQLVCTGWLKSLQQIKFVPKLATIAETYVAEFFSQSA